jgi:hypothetical protein
MKSFTIVLAALVAFCSLSFAQEFEEFAVQSSSPHSIGAAPRIERANLGDFTQKIFVRGDIAFGIDNSVDNYVYFNLNSPGLLNTIGTHTGTDFMNAGAFDLSSGNQSFFYALNGGNFFWTVDTVTGVATALPSPVAPAPQTWSGIAFDPTDGTLYGVTTDVSASSLHIIDPATGAVTLVGNINSPGIIDVCVDGNGDMWAYDLVNDNFLSIDKSTGLGTPVGALGFDANFGQGMAWDPITDVIYLSAFNNTSFQAPDRYARNLTAGVDGYTRSGWRFAGSGSSQ